MQTKRKVQLMVNLDMIGLRMFTGGNSGNGYLKPFIEKI